MSKYVFVTIVLLALVFSLAASASPNDGKKSEGMPPPDSQDQGDSAEMEDIMDAMTDCNETFRIEMSYLQALNESGSFPDETDRTPKCYVRCVLETVEVASADGQFDTTRAETVLMSIRGIRALSNVQETAVTCAADRKESCKCERSYQFVKCLMEMEIKMAEKS